MGRPKILLVDDNQELLRLLARLLEAEGWQPLSHRFGKSAVRDIAKERPAFAIVDVLLPDMLGYDVASALRRASVPFVFMTGVFKGARAALDARVQHGAVGYFDKPFDARRLLDTIREHVPAETPAAPPGPAAPTQGRPSILTADFDVANAVEESAEALDLAGRVEVKEPGNIIAVITGQPLQAAAVPPGPRDAPGPPTARAEPPAEGELRDNLPELITAFWLAQQTGELVVERGRVRKAIYFESGRPCYAISNLLADRLGPFLVRVGKLTPAQLQTCRDTVDRTHRRMGDVLVEMGVLREAEKIYYVAQQVKAIAYSIFAWEEGQYRMHFTGRALGEGIKVDMRPTNLISRGIKKLYRTERIARLLGDGDRLVPTQQPAYALHDVELEDWEAQLLPRVDGTRTVRELATLAKRPPDVVRASLWALVVLDILDKHLDARATRG